jgi:hypothetical protein
MVSPYNKAGYYHLNEKERGKYFQSGEIEELTIANRSRVTRVRRMGEVRDHTIINQTRPLPKMCNLKYLT